MNSELRLARLRSQTHKSHKKDLTELLGESFNLRSYKTKLIQVWLCIYIYIVPVLYCTQTYHSLDSRLSFHKCYDHGLYRSGSILNHAMLFMLFWFLPIADRLRWHSCVFKPAYWAAINVGPRPAEISTWDHPTLYMVTNLCIIHILHLHSVA